MGFISLYYLKMAKGQGVASSVKTVKQYYVVGRALPTEKVPEPELYRMRVFAKDAVRARSKFWYFMKRQHRSAKSRVRSSPPPRSSRRTLPASSHSASSSDTSPVLTLSTCTRNSDQTLSAAPSASFTSSYPVSTPAVVRPFRSSELK